MKKLGKALLVAAFWLSVWALLARLIGKPLLLPPPIAVLRRLGELVCLPDFRMTAAVTLLRILCGAAAGTVLGIASAALTCRFRLVRALLSPLLGVVKAMPVASFIILLLVWIGRDMLPAVTAALMVLPVMWANVSAGIGAVDPQLKELARVYRFPPMQTLRRVVLPAVRPHFLSACRSALGLAWKSGVAAEVLTVPRRSIGRMLYESKLNLDTTDLFAWTAVVVLCSVVIEKLLVAGLARLPGGEHA